jgi:hypothetical protein
MSLGDHVRATRTFLEAFKRAEFLNELKNTESDDNELTMDNLSNARLCHDLKARNLLVLSYILLVIACGDSHIRISLPTRV